jgi:type IV pilus assembly protein PilC
MRRAPNLANYAFLVRQLGAATRRGIAPAEVVDLLREDSDLGRGDRRALEAFGSSLAQGGSIADAMQAAPRVFPEETRQWIQLAQQRGGVPDALAALSRDLEQRSQGERTVRLPLIWPICVSLAMAGVFVVIGTFIMPTMKDLFESFGVPMPGLTRLAFSAGAILFFCVWLPAIGLLVSGFSHRDLPSFLRNSVDRLLERIGFLRRFRRARFTRRLVDLLRTQSGDPALFAAALAHLGATSSGLAWRDAAARLRSAIEAGSTVSQALAREPALPRRVWLHVEMGEKLHDLATALADLDEAADVELIDATARFERGSIVLIYLALGLVVGTFVVAVYLPIFKVGMLA